MTLREAADYSSRLMKEIDELDTAHQEVHVGWTCSSKQGQDTVVLPPLSYETAHIIIVALNEASNKRRLELDKSIDWH